MWGKKRKIKSRFIMQGLAVRILSGALPAEQITICTGEYSIFGSITYISLQAAAVSRRMIGVNFLVCLTLLLLMLLLRRSGTPLAIFALFGEPFRNEYICLRINIKWVTISVEA